MTELTMTPKERQRLKGEAHRLNPLVLLGAEGLSEAVIREIDRALAAHGLIKVRVPGDAREERDRIFAELADRLSAARIQSIGKVLVLFRPLPAGEDAGSQGTEAGSPSARSPKAPAQAPTKKAAGAATAQRGKPGRGEIRAIKSSAPRRTGGRQR